jgi:hypothetical protein
MEQSLDLPQLVFNNIYDKLPQTFLQDEVLKQLVRFNVDTNIQYRTHSCVTNDIHSVGFKRILGKTGVNNADSTFWRDLWINYFNSNGNIEEIKAKLFSKGFNRFVLLRLLMNDPPLLVRESGDPFNYPNLNNKNLDCSFLDNKIIIENLNTIKHQNQRKYHFIISALIIKLQVFSDANHRTAGQYFRLITGLNLQEYNNLIDAIMYDYSLITKPDSLISVISKISDLYEQSASRRQITGGRKKNTRKTKKRNRSRKH